MEHVLGADVVMGTSLGLTARREQYLLGFLRELDEPKRNLNLCR